MVQAVVVMFDRVAKAEVHAIWVALSTSNIDSLMMPGVVPYLTLSVMNDSLPVPRGLHGSRRWNRHQHRSHATGVKGSPCHDCYGIAQKTIGRSPSNTLEQLLYFLCPGHRPCRDPFSPGGRVLRRY